MCFFVKDPSPYNKLNVFFKFLEIMFTTKSYKSETIFLNDSITYREMFVSPNRPRVGLIGPNALFMHFVSHFLLVFLAK